MTCHNPASGGVIAADPASVCAGPVSIDFSETEPVGTYTGTLEYVWQISTSSPTFEVIPGATSETYTYIGTITQTTWFRRLAKVTCEVEWVASNVVKVDVDPLPTASAGGSATISVNGAHQVSGAVAEHGTIKWTHNGEGNLDNNEIIDPTYTPDTADAGKTVTLTLTVTSNNECSPATAIAVYTIYVTSAEPDELALCDMIITGTECFSALELITTGGDDCDFIVEDGGSVRLISGERIVMLPGTHARAGSYLHASITKDGIFCPDPRDHFLAVSDPGDVKSEEVLNVPDPDPLGTAFFRVFPNPIMDVFTVELQQFTWDKQVRIEVYGMRGELIMYREVWPDQSHTFSLSGQQPGIYLVRVTQGNYHGVERLIKR